MQKVFSRADNQFFYLQISFLIPSILFEAYINVYIKIYHKLNKIKLTSYKKLEKIGRNIQNQTK